MKQILYLLLSMERSSLYLKEQVGDDSVTVGGVTFRKFHHEFNAFYDWIIDKRENGLVLLGVRCNFLQEFPELFSYLNRLNYVSREAPNTFELFFSNDKDYTDSEYTGDQLFVNNYIYYDSGSDRYLMTFELNDNANTALNNSILTGLSIDTE